MTIEEPTVLANPADEAAARRLAAERELRLQLNRLVPRGRAFIVDPASLAIPAVEALPESVGICARCGGDVMRTSDGAACGCGATKIPPA